MSGRRRDLGFRSLRLAAVSFLVVLAGCAGSKPAPTADVPEEVGDTVIRPATQVASEPDLMLDDLYLDGVNIGRIPVTVELDEERDVRVVTAYDGDTYVLHSDRAGSIITLDAIAGRLVAMDESTGVWVPLERIESEDQPVATVSDGVSERVSGDEEATWEEPRDSDPHAELQDGRPKQHPFGEIRLPLIVRLANGIAVYAQSIERYDGSCRIIPVEGHPIHVEDLGIFTIESASGLSLTSYVLIEGNSVP